MCKLCTAKSMAKHALKLYRRSVCSGYDDALSDYLAELEPSDDFRDEAIRIFNDIWNRGNPGAAV